MFLSVSGILLSGLGQLNENFNRLKPKIGLAFNRWVVTASPTFWSSDRAERTFHLR